jgi:glycosyltransferase involved in cell wall biosynthesis
VRGLVCGSGIIGSGRMKLVFLCKRRPMGRDLLDKPYGRFFHLPRLLAARGHDVHVALLSYARDASLDVRRDGIRWSSESMPARGMRFVRKLQALVAHDRPDWIVGFSDTYYGILAEWLARRSGSRSLIDAYDNYEGYIPWCKPLHFAWRRAVRGATAVSVAGPTLGELLGRGRDPATMLVASMAPDPLGFAPLPRDECRRALQLPAGTLIGYAGAIYPNRGIDVLFRAFAMLKVRIPDARLVLSGRLHKSIALPAEATWLGYLPDEKMPLLLNGMNALAVLNQSSAFGIYSHPIKLYEAMACGVPVVASRTRSVEWILGGREESLAAPDDVPDLARKLETAVRRERVDYGPTPTWEHVATQLDEFLSRAS